MTGFDSSIRINTDVIWWLLAYVLQREAADRNCSAQKRETKVILRLELSIFCQRAHCSLASKNLHFYQEISIWFLFQTFFFGQLFILPIIFFSYHLVVFCFSFSKNKEYAWHAYSHDVFPPKVYTRNFATYTNVYIHVSCTTIKPLTRTSITFIEGRKNVQRKDLNNFDEQAE